MTRSVTHWVTCSVSYVLVPIFDVMWVVAGCEYHISLRHGLCSGCGWYSLSEVNSSVEIETFVMSSLLNTDGQFVPLMWLLVQGF